MKKFLTLIFALIITTVAFGVTASAVEVTNPEIPTVTMPEVHTVIMPEVPTVTMPEIHTLQEIPKLPTKPEIPTATKPEIHTLQEIPTITIPEIPTITIPETPSKSEPTTNSADTEIPATGSSTVAPVIALLVLAGGATISVKAKKED